MIRPRNKPSKSLRTSLYLNNNGNCTECGCSLDIGWHVDHIIPHCFGGETLANNLRATCPKCNLRKGNKIMKKMTPFEYENMTLFTDHFPNNKNVRTCQFGGYNCIQSHLLSGEKSCSVFLPTGCGKSDLIRSVAIGTTTITRRFSGVWAFSPCSELQEQLVQDEIDNTFERLGINFFRNPFIVSNSLDTPRFRNDSVLESYTTQFLVTGNNINFFLTAATNIKNKTGKLPLAIFDESHLFSTENVWGHTALQMYNAGIPIVLVTGTPFRSDKLQIPGFNLIPKDTSDRNYIQTRNTDDPMKVKVIKGNLKVCRYELEADYSYSYQRAWEENIILNPEPEFIDATRDVYEDILSEMSKRESERILRSFLLDDRTIQAAVEKAIFANKTRKIANQQAAILVTTLMDESENSKVFKEFNDIHANKIKAEFNRQSPQLRVLIVTSNSEDKNGLKRFKEEDYDVLIVKAMGIIGYNCRKIKTILNLSAYRTLPAIIQLIMRGCRHFADLASFDIIMPKDPGMQLLWRQFKDITGLIVEEIVDKTITEEEKEKKEKDNVDNDLKTIFKDHNSSFDPITKRSKSDEIIEKFKEKLPTAYNSFRSNQVVLNIWQVMSMGLGEDWLNKIPGETATKTTLLDCNEEESILRNKAVTIHKELTNHIINIKELPYEYYGNVSRSVWACLKNKCGFKPNQSLDNICSIDNFVKIINAGNELINSLRKMNKDSDLSKIGIRILAKSKICLQEIKN